MGEDMGEEREKVVFVCRPSEVSSELESSPRIQAKEEQANTQTTSRREACWITRPPPTPKVSPKIQQGNRACQGESLRSKPFLRQGAIKGRQVRTAKSSNASDPRLCKRGQEREQGRGETPGSMSPPEVPSSEFLFNTHTHTHTLTTYLGWTGCWSGGCSNDC
jgi:hypothetical protein